MRSDSYIVEVDGYHWVLHIFDVKGEDDILAVQLKIGSREEYTSFQDSFKTALMETRGAHTGATTCHICRPRDVWVSLFSSWIKDAYAIMPFPPSVVGVEDVPEVVRLSMACIYNQDDEPDSSSVN